MGGTTVWEDDHQVPYKFNGDQWVGYDDETSLRLKVKLITATHKYLHIHHTHTHTHNLLSKN